MLFVLKNVANLSYPSCAKTSLLTSSDSGLDSSIRLAAPSPTRLMMTVSENRDAVVETRKIPPRITKPIAGLPPIHDDIARRFTGEHLPSHKTSSNAILQSMFADVLLPTCQNSPVRNSGE